MSDDEEPLFCHSPTLHLAADQFRHPGRAGCQCGWRSKAWPNDDAEARPTAAKRHYSSQRKTSLTLASSAAPEAMAPGGTWCVGAFRRYREPSQAGEDGLGGLGPGEGLGGLVVVADGEVWLLTVKKVQWG